MPSSPERKRKKLTYGGVLLRGDGSVLLRRPTNDHDGYVWTFAKGEMNPGETPEQTALREVLEETGVESEITGVLPGWFVSNLSATQFYLMRPVHDTGCWGRETQAVEWVPLVEAPTWVAKTRNRAGRERDLTVLHALAEVSSGALRT